MIRKAALLRHHLHYLLTLGLALGLGPLCRRAGLRVSFDWNSLASYGAIVRASVPIGALLYGVSMSWAELRAYCLWEPWRYWLLIGLPLLGWLGGGTPWALDALDLLLIGEVLVRTGGTGLLKLLALALPAAYFFLGITLFYDYNEIIASLRDPLAYDPLLKAIDALLLGGSSVSAWSSRLARAGLPGAFEALEQLYYSMFYVLGAGILIVGLSKGLGPALKLTGTLLAAYYLGLAIYAIWPSHGPYALCPDHATSFPPGLVTARLQTYVLERVRQLWHHAGVLEVRGGAYLSFPCLHLGLPLIIAWYLRDRARACAMVLLYCAALSPAILLLEWHYLIDLFGGVAAAGVALGVLGGEGPLPSRPRPGCRSPG